MEPTTTATTTEPTVAELGDELDELRAEVEQLRATCLGAVMFVGNLQRQMERAQLRARGARAQVVHFAGRPDVQAVALAVALIAARRALRS